MAAAQLLKELVQLPVTYDIQLIGAEPHPGYNRILLSSLLAGEKTTADLGLMEDDWYARHGISVFTGETVTSVDVKGRKLFTSTGRTAHYDRLVIATGSRPFVPPVPGLTGSGVMVFRSQADLHAIRQAASTAATTGSNAVVIGGGLLGLEAACGLRKLGVVVTVVNREDRLMPRQLDRTAGEVLQHSLGRQGIEFRLGAEPRQILRTAEVVAGIELSTGERLSCSMVLVTAGIVPECAMARVSGIPCKRGILVNERLETDIGNIYALGECCEINGLTFGLVAPVYEQARVLARVLNHDRKATYIHKEVSTQLKVAGISVVSAGQLPFVADSRSQIVLDRVNGIYRRLVYSREKLAGYVLVGDSLHNAMYEDLLEQDQILSRAGPEIMFGQNNSVAEPQRVAA